MGIDDIIRIRFELTDSNKNNYINESVVPIAYVFNDTELSTIGRQFNAFLAQCGYPRSNTEMLMDSLTEEEVDELKTYLKDIRCKKE